MTSGIFCCRRQAGTKLAVVFTLVTAATLMTAALTIASRSAVALPSFARQTGLGCGACHTDFPQLTPTGRRFKLLGYTQTAADYKSIGTPGWIPPVSAMVIAGFTHTAKSQDNAGSPSSISPNNNSEVQQASIFYGGAITDHIGLFAQATYAGAQFAPMKHEFTWDNLDLRFADQTMYGSVPVIYGLTVNNSPSVQDVWNTTPAWGYPFVASNLTLTPGAKTLVENGLAAHVLGTGGYVYINDMLYLEATAYKTLDPNTQNSLGTDPAGTTLTRGLAPYFRAAIEEHWGRHFLEIGTFGLYANLTLPVVDGVPTAAGPTDRLFDVAFDSQYQYQGDGYWVTLRTTYVHEDQRRDASFANAMAANLNNTLNSFKTQASIAYGGDYNKIIGTVGYFNISGSSDTLLYANNRTFSPNSDGFVFEIAYMPFGKKNAPKLWPWANAKIGLQYTMYNKFNGASYNYDNNGRNARDNDTVYLYFWGAF